jgi:hypothetical protein
MNNTEIIFTRKQIAEILGCTVLTISNREKSGVYPEPRRNEKNNYRYYTLGDVFLLQEISQKGVFVGPILAVMWDMGYKDPTVCERIIDTALEQYKVEKDE